MNLYVVCNDTTSRTFANKETAIIYLQDEGWIYTNHLNGIFQKGNEYLHGKFVGVK